MPPPEDSRDQTASPAPVGRRLIIRPGAIGDAVVSLPAVEHLCVGAKEAEIWCPANNLPLLRWMAPTSSITAVGLDSLRLSGAVLDRLRTFDDIVSWYGANRDDFREQVTGLPIRFLPALPDGSQHAVDFYLAQVGATPGGVPRLPVQRGDDSYAVIHPFSGSRKKNWPLENFRAVARILEPQIPVRWCAGPEEPLEGAERFDDLGELANWLARARLFIGNDSGISHLAAACGVPVVAVFGPSDPRVWAPRGDQVAVLSFSDPVEAVAAAGIRWL